MDMQQLTGLCHDWPRSCFMSRHNLVSRGERELRGERHGKGGRSSLLATAPSFYIPAIFSILAITAPILVLPAAVGAQVRLEVNAGYGTSGTVVHDAVATPILENNLKIDVHDVTSKLKPAPSFGAGVVFPFTTGTDAILSVMWSPTSFRAEEDGGASRDVQDVSVLQGLLSVRRHIGDVLEAGAGIGAGYLAGDDRALLRGGSSFSPVVQATVGAGRNAGEHRVHVTGVVQMQRFDSESIAVADARPGNFMRYALRASMTWKGARK
jgi:hypothetical protein